MTQNSLSPAFVKLQYAHGASAHTMTIPVRINGTPVPGGTNSLEKHVGFGFSIDFVTAMDTWAEMLAPFFYTDVAFVAADLWSQPTPADDPVWIQSTSLTQVGGAEAVTVVASEAVFTFRSHLGGLFRLYLMEPSLLVNAKVLPAAFNASEITLSDFVTGDDSWLYARDNGKPITCLGLKTKTNDVLRRKLLTG